MRRVNNFKKRDILHSIKGGELVNKKNHHNLSPLIIAVRDNYVNKVKILLKNNANLNYQDNNGWSALMWASRYDGNENIFKILLKFNPNLNVQDDNGWSPLMLSSSDGLTNIAELIVKTNANVNLEDEYGRTAFILASEYRYFNIAKLLKKTLSCCYEYDDCYKYYVVINLSYILHNIGYHPLESYKYHITKKIKK